ncbi:MAG: hypothetical protein K9H50_02785 [Aurantimicrobium sp.]|nr:hypothetical protein [Aurantimicrobium sp.]
MVTKRWFARGTVALIAIALVVAPLAACSTPSVGSLDQVGQLRNIDGGVALTIPALWAGRAADGTDVGGVEPAEVMVLEHRDGVDPVDLTRIYSSGAGPQWRAATSQAAAVATLMSARDPEEIDLGFSVTGPIDGPSAGGILTVGLLANLTSTPLIPTVAMTGTISPDGTIGQVGGVATKVKSAAAVGFKTIIVPDNSFGFFDEATGKEIGIVEYGKTLGVTVVMVRTVGEAYKIFTGKEYTPDVRLSDTPSAATEAAIRSNIQSMEARLGAAIAAAPAGTDTETLNLAQSALGTMRETAALKDWPRAYGIGAFAYLRLMRASGAASAQSLVDTQGFEAARTQITAEITAALDEAIAARDAALTTPENRLEKVVYLPEALGWVTYAIASYRGVLDELQLATEESAVVSAGRVLIEERAGVNDMLPDSLTVVSAMPTKNGYDSAEVQGFLSGYSELLARAGQANVDYYTTLSGSDLRADGRFTDDGMMATVAQLAEDVAELTEPKTLSESLSNAATAMTYFVMSNGMLSSGQSFGLSIAEDDLRTSAYAEILDASVDASTSTVESFAAQLEADGYAVGYPLWSTRWATAAATNYRGTPQAANAAWVALNEAWYDAIGLFMMTAITSEE